MTCVWLINQLLLGFHIHSLNTVYSYVTSIKYILCRMIGSGWLTFLLFITPLRTDQAGRMAQLLRRESSCFELPRGSFVDLGSIPGQGKVINVPVSLP